MAHDRQESTDRQAQTGIRRAPQGAASGVADSKLAERALAILQRLTAQKLPAMVQELHGVLLDELWQAADSAFSDDERTAITGDVGHFGQAETRHHLHETMRRELRNPLFGAKSLGETSAGHLREAPLELVETERFEVWLAASYFGNALEQRLQQPLAQLRDLARGFLPDSAILNVEPRGVASAVERALCSLDLSPVAKTLCLRKAVRALADQLSDLYWDVIDAWSGAGVRPVPAPKPVLRPTVNRVHPHSVADNMPADAVPSPAETASPPTPMRSGDLPEETGAGAASRDAVVERLRRLPWDDILAAPDEAGLKQRVLQLLSAGRESRPRLDVQTDERIGATDRMLSHMLGDPILPTNLKELIRSLSMRFLVLALEDPAFYAEASNPMLGMLDQLEHLALLAPDSAELDGLLGEALQTDVRDEHALNDLNQRVQVLVGRRSQEFRRSAERMVASYEGRERLRQAREEVRKRINRSFAGLQMHRAVRQLIEQGWRTLLELSWLRQGGMSAAWQRWWEVLLAAHCHCGGEAPPGIGELPGRKAVKEALHEGLEFIGFDPFHKVVLVDALETAMHRVRAGSDASGGLVDFPEIPAEATAVAAPPGIASDDWTRTLDEVDRLPVGGVLLVRDGGHEVSRHLLWRNADGSELLFVDPRDQEARPVQRSELAGALQQGEARLQPPLEQGVASRAVKTTLNEMWERIGDRESRDVLTGLSARYRLGSVLSKLLRADSRDFAPGVLGFVGLDHFEAVTGKFGYEAGERLLVAIAKQLEIALEGAHCIAYLGGSRFGFLAPAADAAQAEALGEQVRAAVADLPFYWQGKSYPVVCSVGLAMVVAGGDHQEALMSAADAACYAAQGAGGGRVVLFTDADESIARQRSMMDGWLTTEQVVKSRRVRLRCQCIAPADPAQTDPHHHEILLSVYDENGADLPLEEFISTAEAFNRMAEVDRLVLEEVFRWVHENPRAAAELRGIAVNLSGQSMDDEGLIEIIRSGLERFAIDPALISFEVTETAAIGNLDQAAAVIEGIHGLGCRFALDDFGSGMSSYSYLKRLPADYLKIDGSFIKDLLSNPHDEAIVRSINEVAHFMGKQTIAEYVENPEIRDRLLEMGVDYVQGYVVGRPQFLDELV